MIASQKEHTQSIVTTQQQVNFQQPQSVSVPNQTSQQRINDQWIQIQKFNVEQQLEPFNFELLSNKIFWKGSDCFFPCLKIDKIQSHEQNTIGNITVFFLNFSFELTFLNRHRDFCQEQQDWKKESYLCNLEQPSTKNKQNVKVDIKRLFLKQNMQNMTSQYSHEFFHALETVCISKLLSILKIGPKVMNIVGFDFLLYQHALTFYQEKFSHVNGQKISFDEQKLKLKLKLLQQLGINQNRSDRSQISNSPSQRCYVFTQISTKFYIIQKQQKENKKILITKTLNDCFQMIVQEKLYDRSQQQREFYSKYLAKYKIEMQETKENIQQKQIKLSHVPIMLNLFKIKYLLFKHQRQLAKQVYKILHRQLAQNMFLTKNLEKKSPKKENWIKTINEQLAKLEEENSPKIYRDRMNLIDQLFIFSEILTDLRSQLAIQKKQNLLNYRSTNKNSNKFEICYLHLIFIHHFDISEDHLQYLMVNCMAKINPKIHISHYWTSSTSIINQFIAEVFEIYNAIDQNDSIIEISNITKQDKYNYLYYLFQLCSLFCLYGLCYKIFEIFIKKIDVKTHLNLYVKIHLQYFLVFKLQAKTMPSEISKQLKSIFNDMINNQPYAIYLKSIVNLITGENDKLAFKKHLSLDHYSKFQQKLEEYKSKQNWLINKYAEYQYLITILKFLQQLKKGQCYKNSMKIVNKIKKLMANQQKSINTDSTTQKLNANEQFLKIFVYPDDKINNKFDMNKFIRRKFNKFEFIYMKQYENSKYFIYRAYFQHKKIDTNKHSLILKSLQIAKTTNQKLGLFVTISKEQIYYQCSKRAQLPYESKVYLQQMKKLLLYQLESQTSQVHFSLHYTILYYIKFQYETQFLLEYAQKLLKNCQCDLTDHSLFTIIKLFLNLKVLDKIKQKDIGINVTVWQEAVQTYLTQQKLKKSQQPTDFIEHIIKKQDVIYSLKNQKGKKFFKELVDLKQNRSNKICQVFLKLSNYFHNNQVYIFFNTLMDWTYTIFEKLVIEKDFQQFFKIYIQIQTTQPNIYIALIGCILLVYNDQRNKILQDDETYKTKNEFTKMMEKYHKIEVEQQHRINQIHIMKLLDLIIRNSKYPPNSFRKIQLDWLFTSFKIYYYMSQHFYSRRFYYLLKHLRKSKIATIRQYNELKDQISRRVKQKKNNNLGKAVMSKLAKMRKNIFPHSILSL